MCVTVYEIRNIIFWYVYCNLFNEQVTTIPRNTSIMMNERLDTKTCPSRELNPILSDRVMRVPNFSSKHGCKIYNLKKKRIFNVFLITLTSLKLLSN